MIAWKTLCFTTVLIHYFFHCEISEVPRLITAKFCHMVESMFNIIIPIQKFGELSPEKFSELKTCWIWSDFEPLPTLTANISGMDRDIQNWTTRSVFFNLFAAAERNPTQVSRSLTEPHELICESSDIREDEAIECLWTHLPSRALRAEPSWGRQNRQK